MLASMLSTRRLALAAAFSMALGCIASAQTIELSKHLSVWQGHDNDGGHVSL